MSSNESVTNDEKLTVGVVENMTKLKVTNDVMKDAPKNSSTSGGKAVT